MLTQYINKLMQHKNLTPTECMDALEICLDHRNKKNAAIFLKLLHKKNETVTELQAFVNYFSSKMKTISTGLHTLDIVGTGGDKMNTINISSATSLIVASLGVATTKHGNRAITSKCGSADFFESIGIPTDLSENDIMQSLKKYNFAFLYAPHYNKSLKNFSILRKSISSTTTFNLIGPLLNPAKPKYYLMGVNDPSHLPLLAELLMQTHIHHALIVHSCGLDEISLIGKTIVYEIKNSQINIFELDPKDYKLPYCVLSDIQGNDVQTNKELILNAMIGSPGPIQNTLILNAAAALYASDRVKSIHEGVMITSHHVKKGCVYHYIKNLTRYFKIRELSK